MIRKIKITTETKLKVRPGLSEPLFISDLELSLSVLVGEALVLSMDFVLSFLGVNSDLRLPSETDDTSKLNDC
jgi:hypothetical protein